MYGPLVDFELGLGLGYLALRNPRQKRFYGVLEGFVDADYRDVEQFVKEDLSLGFGRGSPEAGTYFDRCVIVIFDGDLGPSIRWGLFR